MIQAVWLNANNSQRIIEQANAAIQQQQALIEVANSNLHLAQLNLNRFRVVAPADGTLANFDLRVGNYVEGRGEAVCCFCWIIINFMSWAILKKLSESYPCR